MEKSFCFNSINGDRKYKAEDFREYFATFIGNGVFPNPSTNLQCIGENGDMTVTLKAGNGWINGALYVNDNDLILPIDVADGVLNRIDRIVLRMDTLGRAINAVVKKGVFASSPVAPVLQRDADAYELGIADIYIAAGATQITQANITDLRLNTSLCGIVHGTIDQVDTTTLFNQYLSWLTQKQTDFNNWYNNITSASQTEIDSMEAQFQNDWNNWFATVQSVLDGDTAGSLLNMINEYKADCIYQIPNIVGTQIRINRLSDTNRLFFKLSSDLSGGAITISTDGGTTEKPLKDIDGNTLTMLEKGFVEVVADANFFTLRNRGISATQKQQLIDIVNVAEENQSTIKANITSALNTKTGSSLTSSSSWIDIQNIINNMSNTNKKYKIGVTNTDANGVLTVSGLPFRPKSFILTTTKGTYRGRYSYTEDITIDSNLILGGYLNSDGHYLAFLLSSAPAITSNSFTVDFSASYFTSTPVNWIVFG